MLNLIEEWFQRSAQIQAQFLESEKANLLSAAKTIVAAFNQGGKLLIFGNGGSAADAQHLAAEFVNKLRLERPPLPALALTTDSSILTSVANDYSFDEIFAKQIKALAKVGVVVLAISTSGRSQNVLAAIREARARGLASLALTGLDGGPLAQEVDIALVAPGEEAAHIQEVHLMAEHLLCELVDNLLFERPGESGD